MTLKCLLRAHVVFDSRRYLGECRKNAIRPIAASSSIGLTPAPALAPHWKGEKMESTFPISVHHFHSCTRAPPGRARWRNRGRRRFLITGISKLYGLLDSIDFEEI